VIRHAKAAQAVVPGESGPVTLAPNVSAYDREAVTLEVCERLVAGDTINKIFADRDDLPNKVTFLRWLWDDETLRAAYRAARELSAYIMEDEALDLAREIKNKPDTGTKVRAFEVALNQLRWSASRRNPREYGDRTGTNIVVPIQINTPLDLGQPGARSLEDEENVYDITAQVARGDGSADEGNA